MIYSARRVSRWSGCLERAEDGMAEVVVRNEGKMDLGIWGGKDFIDRWLRRSAGSNTRRAHDREE
jgi:hypothetical protein